MTRQAKAHTSPGIRKAVLLLRKEGNTLQLRSAASLVFQRGLSGTGWLVPRPLVTGTWCLSICPPGREDLMLAKGRSWPEGRLRQSRPGFSTTPGWLWLSCRGRFLVSLWSLGSGSTTSSSTRSVLNQKEISLWHFFGFVVFSLLNFAFSFVFFQPSITWVNIGRFAKSQIVLEISWSEL